MVLRGVRRNGEPVLSPLILDGRAPETRPAPGPNGLARPDFAPNLRDGSHVRETMRAAMEARRTRGAEDSAGFKLPLSAVTLSDVRKWAAPGGPDAEPLGPTDGDDIRKSDPFAGTPIGQNIEIELRKVALAKAAGGLKHSKPPYEGLIIFTAVLGCILCFWGQYSLRFLYVMYEDRPRTVPEQAIFSVEVVAYRTSSLFCASLIGVYIAWRRECDRQERRNQHQLEEVEQQLRELGEMLPPQPATEAVREALADMKRDRDALRESAKQEAIATWENWRCWPL